MTNPTTYLPKLNSRFPKCQPIHSQFMHQALTFTKYHRFVQKIISRPVQCTNTQYKYQPVGVLSITNSNSQRHNTEINGPVAVSQSTHHNISILKLTLSGARDHVPTKRPRQNKKKKKNSTKQ